jgi:hypothetical protein
MIVAASVFQGERREPAARQEDEEHLPRLLTLAWK